MKCKILSLVIDAVLLVALAVGGTPKVGGEAGAAPELTAEPVVELALETETADTPALYRPAQEVNASEILAKMIWGEARGCTPVEQAACVWCVLNRVENPDPYYPDSIIGVVTQPNQFHGYDPDNPVDPDILALVEDVLARWSIEGICTGDVGRVLPKEYIFFHGDGQHNYFRTEWSGGTTWDWSLDSPYREA